MKLQDRVDETTVYDSVDETTNVCIGQGQGDETTATNICIGQG